MKMIFSLNVLSGVFNKLLLQSFEHFWDEGIIAISLSLTALIVAEEWHKVTKKPVGTRSGP